jgi:PEP-CTERM motif-containing protein
MSPIARPLRHVWCLLIRRQQQVVALSGEKGQHMRRVFRVVTFIVLLAVVGSRSAHADPLGPTVVIGTFEWVDDILFGGGSTFNVNNESASAFESIAIDLFAQGDSTPFQTLLIGDIPSAGFAQSFEDLSALIVGTDLVEAVLRFTFDNAPLTATLFAASLTGDPATLLATSVDLEAPAPVPEPTTLVLLTSGLAAAAWRRRRGALGRRPHEAPGPSLAPAPSQH